MLRVYGKSVMDTPQGRLRLREQEHMNEPKHPLSVFHRSYPRLPPPKEEGEEDQEELAEDQAEEQEVAAAGEGAKAEQRSVAW